jgi:hypothetical protein
MNRLAVRAALSAAAGLVLLTPAACTRGQGLRGTTSLAVKAALSDNHLKYKGDITCTGNNLPITCIGTTTDGKPIAATLAPGSDSGCVLVVTVGGQQIARESGGRCK